MQFLFRNKSYDFIIYIYDVINKILSCVSNYIVYMESGNSSISMIAYDISMITFLSYHNLHFKRVWSRKPNLRGAFSSSSIIWDCTRYNWFDKKFKTKSQNLLEADSFESSPSFILNRVKIGNEELIGVIFNERQTFQDHWGYLLLKQIKQIDYYEGILLRMSTLLFW